jgi:crotonobetainyl-CoA:carnitine CoA-transferase CaiB-like acyl-CoA transferase
MSMADIFKDPHYRERESIIEVPSEVGPLAQPAVIPRLSATPGRVTHAGPPLGKHTDEVLAGLLGLTGQEISALRSERVV